MEYHCDVCNLTCNHPNQWKDHLSKSLHANNVAKAKYKKELTESLSQKDNNLMILDLEGSNLDPRNFTDDIPRYVILEISYLIFSQSKGIVKKNQMIVKAGKTDDYPQLDIPRLIWCIHHKHGLPFSVCEKNGVDVQSAWNILSSDLSSCKAVFAKGATMERTFLDNCILQGGFNKPKYDIPVFDLDHIPNLSIGKFDDCDMTKYKSCGHHITEKETGKILHCSQAEVEFFYECLTMVYK